MMRFKPNVVALKGLDAAKACVEAAHRAVRLGNPLVALSRASRGEFAAIFDGNVSQSGLALHMALKERLCCCHWRRHWMYVSATDVVIMYIPIGQKHVMHVTHCQGVGDCAC